MHCCCWVIPSRGGRNSFHYKLFTEKLFTIIIIHLRTISNQQPSMMVFVLLLWKMRRKKRKDKIVSDKYSYCNEIEWLLSDNTIAKLCPWRPINFSHFLYGMKSITAREPRCSSNLSLYINYWPSAIESAHNFCRKYLIVIERKI